MRACSAPPSLLEQRSVGHLLGEGVLEGVLVLGEEARLVEELGRLEMRDTTMQRVLGRLGHGLKEGEGHLGANDCHRLQHTLLLGRQPVDAGGQHRLHRGGDVQRLHGLRQAIVPRLTHQHLGLDQGAHAFFQEERVPLGLHNEECFERRETGVIPQQSLQQLVRARRW
jgi:hypothetical protein